MPQLIDLIKLTNSNNNMGRLFLLVFGIINMALTTTVMHFLKSYLNTHHGSNCQLGRVFANSHGNWGSIQGQVMPKTQKNGT